MEPTEQRNKTAPDKTQVDRRRMIKRAGMLWSASSALAALAIPAHAAQQIPEANTSPTKDDDIAGLWEAVLSSPANLFPPFKAFELYGGAIWIGSGDTDLTPAALDSALWGTFKRVGDRQYRVIGRFWTYDPNANLTGFGAVKGAVTVSEDGKRYRGEESLQFFDTNGNPLGPASSFLDIGERICIPD